MCAGASLSHHFYPFFSAFFLASSEHLQRASACAGEKKKKANEDPSTFATSTIGDLYQWLLQ